MHVRSEGERRESRRGRPTPHHHEMCGNDPALRHSSSHLHGLVHAPHPSHSRPVWGQSRPISRRLHGPRGSLLDRTPQLAYTRRVDRRMNDDAWAVDVLARAAACLLPAGAPPRRPVHSPRTPREETPFTAPRPHNRSTTRPPRTCTEDVSGTCQGRVRDVSCAWAIWHANSPPITTTHHHHHHVFTPRR